MVSISFKLVFIMTQQSLSIKQILVLNDNYVYLLTCPTTGQTAVVDPAVAAPVINALNGQPLHYILNTHHHADHTGANLQLKEKYGCTVVGAAVDDGRIPGIDVKLKEGDTFPLGHHTAQIFETHGHTRGHIVYYFKEDHALFCGDTLFSGGCGRLFEGTADDMFLSLQKIKALPDATNVYCAHEYTLQNYTFLRHIAPENKAVEQRFLDVQALRQAGKRTVPSLLGEEKKSNLFLTAKNAEAFAALRVAKDHF